MKTIKFAHHLVQKILDGSKTATWRLFDDKDLTTGDMLQFIDTDTSNPFAEAEITNVREKYLGEIENQDYEGHEPFESPEAMLATFRKYYGDMVSWDTPVKMISFRLLKTVL
ncbi:MAG: ASCH domain-containing protein [Patescibacteria group bacterium]|nr:ASCH domain-containing protein [Patescibacteria group bacterium]MDE2437917.1 ASCH domain-containing protein [Patescibacteria group bacterium]